MHIGYCRVSTKDQQLNLQQDALREAGCEEIYTDVVSGIKTNRPGLTQALDTLRKEDTLVVWKLDRLGRSIRHLIDTVTSLNEKQIGFKSLQEQMDTTSSGGKLIFHLFSALAEFERDVMRERTQAGLKAARARGRLGGRPPALSTKEIKKLQQHYHKRQLSVLEIAKLFNISKPTLYRYLRHR